MNQSRAAIRALIVEDSPDDAELVTLALKYGGYQGDFVRVETLEDLSLQLARGPWDIVISDYSLVGFTALDALRVVKRAHRELPFIIVSSSLGEETAVQAMKAGAHDFFLKDHLTRLGAAIDRELRDAAVRRERAEIDEALRRTQMRLEVALAASAVGTWVWDVQSGTLVADERLAAFFDLDAAAAAKGVPSNALIRAIHEDDRARVQRLIDDAIARCGSFEAEFRVKGSDDLVRWIAARGRVEGDARGTPLRFPGALSDITERKRSEEQLKQAIEARDDFLSIASHELKTPITALALQLELALRLVQSLEEGEPKPRLKMKMEAAVRQVQRLTALINGLLDVTRITSGRVALSPTRLDLSEVVQSILARLQDLVQRSKSVVSFRTAGPVIGFWDPLGIESVVTNLLSNAIKFGEGKPIEVVVDSIDGMARLIVSDLGIGIPSEEQERIFQRFERAVSSHHFGGFGIGLWVTRQVIEAHKGTIQVRSEVGAGTTFIVELPLTPELTPDAEQRRQPP